MLGIRVPEPDQAMLISGGGGQQPFKVVLGKRKFVMPGINKVDFLTLAQQQHTISEDCFTREKIAVRVVATIAFKVPAEEKAIIDAGQRFLRDQNLMPKAVGQITAGAVRGIVGTMTLDQIISDRTALQQNTFEHASQELADKGLQVDTLNISDVQDLSPGSSAIESLSAPHLAEIRRDAAVATAKANQASVEAQQESERNQANFARETAINKSNNDAQVAANQATADQQARVAQAEAEARINKAQAEAEQAGPLAQANAQQEVTAAETKLAEQSVELKRQQLERDVVQPAEAAKKQRIAQAQAEAEATTLAAQAAASNDRVALDSKVVEQFPEIVRAAASGLANANVTIFDGGAGVERLLTQVVSEGARIFEAARGFRTAATNGHVPAEEAEALAPGRAEPESIR